MVNGTMNDDDVHGDERWMQIYEMSAQRPRYFRLQTVPHSNNLNQLGTPGKKTHCSE
jgi:hypothetical protein